jgi:hypothetical protein
MTDLCIERFGELGTDQHGTLLLTTVRLKPDTTYGFWDYIGHSGRANPEPGTPNKNPELGTGNLEPGTWNLEPLR